MYAEVKILEVGRTLACSDLNLAVQSSTFGEHVGYSLIGYRLEREEWGTKILELHVESHCLKQLLDLIELSCKRVGPLVAET